MLGHVKELPISPMKKLKILSENQNIHNKFDEARGELISKYDSNVNDLKIKMSSLKPQEQKIENDTEPLLQETVGQYVIFPINHHDMWKMYKELVENFWSTTENIGNLDALHLNENEKKFLKLMCSFYATLDQSCGIVSENFAEEFSKLIQVTEAKFYYGHQLFVQNIHFEMYNKLFETLVKSDTERNELYLTMATMKSAKNKRNWVKKWSENSVSFADKLVASVCLHGIFFCTINLIQQWFKERTGSGSFTNATSYNHEFIEIIDKMVIDEDSHRDFSCLMISHLRVKPSQEFILNLINEAVEIEKAFLNEAIPYSLLNLTEKFINQTIDKRASILKYEILKAFDTTSKMKQQKQSEQKVSADTTDVENSVKLVKNNKEIKFDEDF